MLTFALAILTSSLVSSSAPPMRFDNSKLNLNHRALSNLNPNQLAAFLNSQKLAGATAVGNPFRRHLLRAIYPREL